MPPPTLASRADSLSGPAGRAARLAEAALAAAEQRAVLVLALLLLLLLLLLLANLVRAAHQPGRGVHLRGRGARSPTTTGSSKSLARAAGSTPALAGPVARVAPELIGSMLPAAAVCCLRSSGPAHLNGSFERAVSGQIELPAARGSANRPRTGLLKPARIATMKLNAQYGMSLMLSVSNQLRFRALCVVPMCCALCVGP